MVPSELRWTLRAIEEYEKLLEYLIEEWGELIANRIRTEINHQFIRIHRDPTQFPVFRKSKNTRRCVASPQTSIYFKVHKDFIEILSVFDNRQNPKKRKL